MIDIIIPTNEQKDGIKKAEKWFKKLNKPVFKIQGLAGTGKTTIVHVLMDILGIKLEDVLFCTYVGKASLRMRMEGLNARTIHSTIYNYDRIKELDEEGNPIQGRYRLVQKLKDSIPRNIKLIVVDEAGMVPTNIGKDLMSFGIPIISLGDKHQLPPVFGISDFLIDPDVELTQIMRQKEGDPIIKIAKLLIDGIDIPIGQYGPKCFVVDEDILKYKEVYKKSNIVLCGKNVTRDKINEMIRSQVYDFKGDFPTYGDKLVCRKNYWDINIDDIPLINGMFGYVSNVDFSSFNNKTMKIDFRPEFMEYSNFLDLPLDYKYFISPHEDRIKMNKGYSNGILFEYGYSSTVHLAQGSQYSSIMVIEERIGNDAFHKKWAYTAATRAEDTLIWVKKKKKNFYNSFNKNSSW